MTIRFRALVAAAAAAIAATIGRAQQPTTRVEAVNAALRVGPRLAVARADTAVAYARILAARELPNPTLAGSYSKDPPQYHATVELPFDFPWLRQPRVRAAEASRLAAHYRFDFEHAAAALDADTTYTRALAALAHARLSRRNGQDADSLRRMAVRRRDVGDASDLDVELATVSAGQQANVAAADSLTFISSVLDLQTVMGLATDRVEIVPSDSLVPPEEPLNDGDAPPVATLEVAAAEQSLASAALTARLQRRSVWGAPSLTAGFDTHDPGGQRGLLPAFGVALPLPLFSWNRGAIAEAEAERTRAAAELSLARIEGAARIARARRERDIALAKVRRDRALVASANRVAAMSLTAYREGESSLPNVLEAQRNAREILGQYIDDVAAAWIAAAALHVFTLTVENTTR